MSSRSPGPVPWLTRFATRSARLRGDLPLAALDATVAAAALAIVLVLRFDGAVPAERWASLAAFLPVAVLVTLGSGAGCGLYGQIWTHASILEARRLVTAGCFSFTALLVLALLGLSEVPLSVLVLGSLATTGLQGLLRFQSRLFAYRRRQSDGTGVRVLVLGAGHAGAALAHDMLEHPASGLIPVGFLDDDHRKQGRYVHGVRVLGPVWDLVRQAADHDVQQAVLAVTDAPHELVTLATRLAEEAGVVLRVLPNRAELMGSVVTLRDVRDVQIDDLLGRQQVTVDLEAVRNLLRGKRVMITGAGGSIGSEIARQVAQCEPALLVLLDHDETHLHDAAGAIPTEVVQVLCDIRQRGLVHQVLATHRPQVVFHAAAHKHVPLLEDHPAEAVKTNVHGTRNLVDAATTVGVERLVFVSTDKAVQPRSVMGASKAVGEQIVLQAASDVHRFCAVRFGNVLGSRGSVIPTFVRQIQQGGPVTITDARMTRFFMSIPEAVQLVLQSAALSSGGEIFMLEMGEPVQIMDLAQRMIRLSGRRVGTDIEIRVIGMRPGEKLAEELVAPEEGTQPTAHPSIVRLSPVLLDGDVLAHELRELVAAADAGCLSVLRPSLFAIAGRTARRRAALPGFVPTQQRRVIELTRLERIDSAWTPSTT